MKLHYYPDTDSLYIEFVDRTSVESEEVAPGVVMDYDADGKAVGLDIERASGVVDLSELETRFLPLVVSRATA